MFLDCPAKLVRVNSKGHIVLSCVDKEKNWYKIVLSYHKTEELVHRLCEVMIELDGKE